MTASTHQCICGCGQTAFTVSAPALFRIYCHCTICQGFNQAPFADVLIFKRDDVVLPAAEAVSFDTYKPPPNVQRGKCAKCGMPALELFDVPLLPALAMVPAAMFPHQDSLPGAAMHLFYDKRQANIDDALPKYRGFLPSQWAILSQLWAVRRRVNSAR